MALPSGLERFRPQRPELRLVSSRPQQASSFAESLYLGVGSVAAGAIGLALIIGVANAAHEKNIKFAPSDPNPIPEGTPSPTPRPRAAIDVTRVASTPEVSNVNAIPLESEDPLRQACAHTLYSAYYRDTRVTICLDRTSPESDVALSQWIAKLENSGADPDKTGIAISGPPNTGLGGVTTLRNFPRPKSPNPQP